ncbi:hypothetical protein IFM89_017878 [Coptis chinensis]|uniref:Uncharacterized protein n=1 Tax=Coptis chinensis TaxID=261450 RepID=A0A835MA77_9MAGN|nr:hypothetical protein IFM89_017878 [Coptis chinensis]
MLSSAERTLLVITITQFGHNILVVLAYQASRRAHFVVKDSDIVGSQVIGVVAITVENIISGNKIEGSFQILNMSNRKPCNPGAILKISIQYIPIERLTTRSSRYILPSAKEGS